MFAVLITALLCLVSVAHSDPASCENLVQPQEEVDPHQFEGQWAFIAGSLNDSRAELALKGRDSVAIYFRGSSYTRVNKNGDECEYHQRNITVENNVMKFQVKNFNFTGTFYQTSCQDCVLMTMEIHSDHYNTIDFYLLSKNRVVEDKVLEDFKSQAECLKLPAPVKMDSSKELCPEQAAEN